MEFGSLACCGIKEIRYLGQSSTPHAAMRCFALGCLGGNKRVDDTVYHNGLYNVDKGGKVEPTVGIRFRYAIFSEATSPGSSYPAKYGRMFAQFITENKLGMVIKTDTHINPNSGNILQAYIWTVDHDALRGWWEKENGPKEAASGKGI